jgi:hydrogenase large subunit
MGQRTQTLDVPLNRVEGDLNIRVDVQDGQVVDSWSSGTMFRGFEQIMIGRGPLDGLVMTPRICGICSTGHLTAASRALDMIAAVNPPPDAVRMRNLALMTEHVQSDMRHGFLTFAADLVNPAYRNYSFFAEAVERYEPFKGSTVLQVIRQTKKVLGIVSLIGGQWPHSSFMVPGGLATTPSAGDLLQCRLLLRTYIDWYEQQILGCSLERWQAVQSEADLDRWLEENLAQRNSDIGFFIRACREIGLDRIGRGYGNFISLGALDLPEGSSVVGPVPTQPLVPAGFACGTAVETFSQQKIAEHVAHSWFEDYEGGRHPFQGETRPYASGQEGQKYSWAKAPRYNDKPAETGPLAERIVAGDPLFTELVGQSGPTVFSRQLARLTRPVTLFPAMQTWLDETHGGGEFYRSPAAALEGEGFGLTQASRGALGHWVRIKNGAIDHYQIISPTSWNSSPRDSSGARGPWEEALLGTPLRNPDDPVELGHVIRSFDACLVCTVHMAGPAGSRQKVSFGV